jgi:RNA polymerase sigma-70 factor (ECF subfamily)
MTRMQQWWGVAGAHVAEPGLSPLAARGAGDERNREAGHAMGWGRRAAESAAESDLLRAGRAGDRAALEQLLGMHQRSLFGLCYGMLAHADDAEDAVQETFLRALRALPGFRGDSAFGTWLFRIAVNICLRWKTTSIRPTGSRSLEAWNDERFSASADAASPEAIALRHLRISEALQTLMPRHRAILLLKEREGWSVRDIAAALGCNEKRVENELAKARRVLVEWRRWDAGEGEQR